MENNTYSWMSPKVAVRETEKTGKGIFAQEKIKKDEIISVFGGYIITRVNLGSSLLLAYIRY